MSCNMLFASLTDCNISMLTLSLYVSKLDTRFDSIEPREFADVMRERLAAVSSGVCWRV